jgi:single-strand DNA-binding protein
MMNTTNLIGRWTKDPDLRYTPQGTAVANGTIAVQRPYAKEGQQDVDFINVVIWNKQAENACNYTKKGSLVGVVGHLQTRTYDDKDKKTVYVTEVVAERVQFLDSKKSEGQSA